MNSAKVLIVALWRQFKNWDEVYKKIITKVAPDGAFIDEAKRYINFYGEDNILTPIDDRYRELGLDKLKHPPFVVNLKECN